MTSFDELVTGEKFIVPPRKQRGICTTWLLMKIKAFVPEAGQLISLCDGDGSHAWVTRKTRCNAMRVENGTFCFVRVAQKVIQVS